MELSWEQQVWVLRMKTIHHYTMARNALFKRMQEIAEGKVKLRPEGCEDPDAAVVVE